MWRSNTVTLTVRQRRCSEDARSAAYRWHHARRELSCISVDADMVLRWLSRKASQAEPGVQTCVQVQRKQALKSVLFFAGARVKTRYSRGRAEVSYRTRLHLSVMTLIRSVRAPFLQVYLSRTAACCRQCYIMLAWILVRFANW